MASNPLKTELLVHRDGRVLIDLSSNGQRTVTVEPADPALFVPLWHAETFYPVELIRAILDAKGIAYLCDEILRDESPSYVQRFLQRDLLAYLSREWFVSKRILDFGCGAGASTVCLARMFPHARIVGVELDPVLLNLAERRMRYYGYSNMSLLRSPSSTQLPSDLPPFDLVILSAVYEHLLPHERTVLLPLLWRLVKPGGILFLNQTPHRWFPIETHTTGLPFINYLPDRLALAAARAFSVRIRSDESWENLLRCGIRGATEQELMSVLIKGGRGKPVLLEPTGEDVHDRIDLWFQALNPHRYRFAKQLIRSALKTLCKVTGLTLVPILSLALQNEGESK